ncbi:MAG: LapA family protein [Ahrensia sp.]|nr:LapA family protein [Ahrensia sp.]
MLNRLTTLFILVPVGIIVLALAVANRQSVTLAVPPDVNGEPLFSATMPMFAVVFVSVLIGMVIGSCATWFKQGRYRKDARVQKSQVRQATSEAEKQKERADALASELTAGEAARAKLGLPAPAKSG